MLKQHPPMPSLPIAAITLSCCAFVWTGRLLPDDRDKPAQDKICATVDDQPIYQREVERELARVLGGREVTAAALDALRRKTLSQLIDRRLVLKYLGQEKALGASQQEVDRQIRRIRARLARENLELDEYLDKANLTLRELRYATAWEIGWPRFLKKHLTDENLARYFAQHQRDLNGTELLVAHILFEVEPPNDTQTLEDALAEAQDVRRRVRAGEISFAEAARQHSSAASATDGGQIGRIGRRQPMPEAFSHAAFALDKREISMPVATAFGVHLIQCQEIYPGRKQWEEVRTELEQEITRYLFHWAADQQRATATVKIMERS